MPVQIICKSHKDLIKTKKAMLQKRSNMAFLGTQRQITPKPIIRSGWNLNSFEILLLSWLPASLKMIQSKVKPLSSSHFLHYKPMGKIFVA